MDHPSEFESFVDDAIRPNCLCGKPAGWVAERHVLDFCRWMAKDGKNITVNGDVVDLLCTSCLKMVVDQISREIVCRKHALRRHSSNDELVCAGCQRTISGIHDMLEVSQLSTH